MKLIVTKNSLISLENVRRVDLRESTSKHTSHGKPYTITHYDVVIIYTDKTNEYIACGEDENGRVTANLLMDKIVSILSEKS